MSYILDRDSKVNCVSRTASGAEYTLTLSDELKIGAVPHGGYVLVCLLSACADFFGPTHPDPITVTGYYLAPTTAGWPAKIRVELIKKGRYSLARAVLSQVAQGGNETQRTMCMATFGNLDKEEGPTRLLDLKNPVAPRATCVSSGEFKAIASNEKDANNKPRMTANMRLLEEQLHDPEVPFPDIYTANPDSGRGGWLLPASGPTEHRDERTADYVPRSCVFFFNFSIQSTFPIRSHFQRNRVCGSVARTGDP